MGRFTLEWLDTSILAVWSFLLGFVLLGGAASLLKRELPSEFVIALASSTFVCVSAIRLLQWRERTPFIVPAGMLVSASVIWLGYVPRPVIGMWTSSLINGCLLAAVAALVPTFDDCWQRVKPYPRAQMLRPTK